MDRDQLRLYNQAFHRHFFDIQSLRELIRLIHGIDHKKQAAMNRA
jgi:hypothetical protein